jgi:tRNA-specific 2-thiouridylase
MAGQDITQNKQRVVVGMSGGVDSSVAAYLLVQQGYDVVGLFMRNWNDATVTLEDECPWIDDSRDAMMVAEQLGIPFQVVDFSAAYKDRIVDYMFKEYQEGRTPNPDVLCNREIKFDLFLKEALKLGADFVATGHYVRKGVLQNDNGGVEYQLLRGLDPNKDQSYFLCQLNAEQLSKALFPIGELQKSEVRSIATQLNLVTADKKDSQGLCFIGKVSLPDFLMQQLAPKEGRVIEIDRTHPSVLAYETQISQEGNADSALMRLALKPEMGVDIGVHRGAHFYTRGQRRGLNIGGKILPLFVIQTSVADNIIYVGQGEDHPGLGYRGLKISKEEAHWVRPSVKELSLKRQNFFCQIRYRQAPFSCQITQDSQGDIIVIFSNAQRNVTPGQFLALYDAEELIFSGVIAF